MSHDPYSIYCAIKIQGKKQGRIGESKREKKGRREWDRKKREMKKSKTLKGT